MTKVLFVLVGEGFGHAKRCLSVIKRLPKDFEVHAVSHGTGLHFLKQYSEELGFTVGETFPDYVTKFEGEAVDLSKSTDPLKILLRGTKAALRESKILKEFKPDVVVSDSKLSAASLAASKGIPNVYLANQMSTYNLLPKGLNYYAIKASEPVLKRLIFRNVDRILFSNFPAPYDLGRGLTDIDLGNPQVEFIGPCLYWDPVTRKVNPKSKKVMSTLSGVGVGLELVKQLKAISESSDYKFRVTTGSQTPAELGIESSKNFKVSSFVPDEEVYQMYLESSAVIGTGGYTALTESVCSGLPFISSYPENHLEKKMNVENADRLKAGVNLGSDPSTEQVRNALDEVFNVKNGFFDACSKFQDLSELFNGSKRASEVIQGLVA
ncbi:MAG: hypothetical protein GOV15_00365 [Candidatus Diapherotrites archaeon]|nr:hypothetical protein [Candidatus Diapherotrites archaeon]